MSIHWDYKKNKKIGAPMSRKGLVSNEKRRTIEPTIWVAVIAALSTIVTAYLSYYSTVATASIQATATAAAVNARFTATPTRMPTLTTITPVPIGTLNLRDQVDTLAGEVSSLQTEVAANQALKQELDSVNNRLNEMEAVIGNNPSEAMAYVVLRKELDETRSDIKDLESRLTSSWTQNLPLYGLVVTVGFTLLSIIRSDRKQNQEQSRNNNRNREDQRFE